MYKLLVTVI